MKNERGNVLFLILIAVVLFAALSYAVTQSTRGGGNSNEEGLAISTAEYTQLVANLRVTIQRMILSGTDIADIEMCAAPNDFCLYTLVGFEYCSTGVDCVFAPEGGGFDVNRLLGKTNRDIVFYESSYTTSMAGHSGSEQVIMIYASDVSGNKISLEFCQKLNEEHGLSTTIEKEDTLADNLYANGTNYEGQWDFCYDLSPNPTVYYSAMHLLAVR